MCGCWSAQAPFPRHTAFHYSCDNFPLSSSSYPPCFRRYGLYAPIRNAIGVDPDAPKERIPFYKKFVAGGTAGALAAFFANPTDLMKVRAVGALR